MRSRLAGIAAFWCFSSLVSAAGVANSTPPNVVFVLVDDLGWSDLRPTATRYPTPRIAELEGSGLSFTDFYAAAPVCSPTRASLWSGQSPARLGLTDFVPGHWRRFAALTVPEIEGGLPLEITTPGQALGEAGYACAYFGKWHLGEGKRHPSRRGFETAITTGGRHFAPEFSTRPQTEVAEGTALADFLTDQAIEFIDDHRGGPFFVVVSHFAVHIPIEATADEVAAAAEISSREQEGLRDGGWFRNDTYAALLGSVDRSVGRLHDALVERELAQDTVFVFTSDNGGLHHIYTGAGDRATDNAPLRGEKGSLYEGGIRVPCIVRWPGVTEPGSVCSTPVSSIDLAPTLCELAGEAATLPQVLDGESLVPLLRDPLAKLERDALFFHYPHYHHDAPAGAIRSGRWKLMERFEDGRLELYDLASDLGESDDLADRHPEVVAGLHARLRSWREEVGAAMPVPNPEHDPSRASEWWSRGSGKPVDVERLAGHYRQRVVGAASSPAPSARPRPDADRERPSSPPNVVLIISDDQHWADYSFMGHPHIRTPRLDRLASQSLTFTRGYVPSSLCCPSLASMVTGLYPHQHKITGNEPLARRSVTPAEYRAACEEMDAYIDVVPTLPRLLAGEGYLSMQTGKWWLGSYSRGGFTHGMTHGDPDRGGRHGDEGLKISRQGLGPVADFLDHAQDEGRPFFLWHAPFLPHTPHAPPERILARMRGLTESLPVAKYWAMCEWFDETCGQLLDLLLQKGVAENTVVLYVTDNGWIQRPERGGYAPRSKRSPYDGGLRTPIMVHWPGHVAPRRDDETLVSSLDLAPTILRACGLPASPDLPGLDLRDAGALASRERIFGEVFEHDAVDRHEPGANLSHRWCIEGRYKLIVPNPALRPDGEVELFDVLADPNELQDLSSAEPQAVARLRAELDAWWSPAR